MIIFQVNVLLGAPKLESVEANDWPEKYRKLGRIPTPMGEWFFDAHSAVADFVARHERIKEHAENLIVAARDLLKGAAS